MLPGLGRSAKEVRHAAASANSPRKKRHCPARQLQCMGRTTFQDTFPRTCGSCLQAATHPSWQLQAGNSPRPSQTHCLRLRGCKGLASKVFSPSVCCILGRFGGRPKSHHPDKGKADKQFETGLQKYDIHACVAFELVPRFWWSKRGSQQENQNVCCFP